MQTNHAIWSKSSQLRVAPAAPEHSRGVQNINSKIKHLVKNVHSQNNTLSVACKQTGNGKSFILHHKLHWPTHLIYIMTVIYFRSSSCFPIHLQDSVDLGDHFQLTGAMVGVTQRKRNVDHCKNMSEPSWVTSVSCSIFSRILQTIISNVQTSQVQVTIK